MLRQKKFRGCKRFTYGNAATAVSREPISGHSSFRVEHSALPLNLSFDERGLPRTQNYFDNRLTRRERGPDHTDAIVRIVLVFSARIVCGKTVCRDGTAGRKVGLPAPYRIVDRMAPWGYSLYCDALAPACNRPVRERSWSSMHGADVLRIHLTLNKLPHLICRHSGQSAVAFPVWQTITVVDVCKIRSLSATRWMRRCASETCLGTSARTDLYASAAKKTWTYCGVGGRPAFNQTASLRDVLCSRSPAVFACGRGRGPLRNSASIFDQPIGDFFSTEGARSTRGRASPSF